VCGSSATVTPTVQCSSKYYCPGGQSSSTEYPCIPGSFCVAGVAVPSPCPGGTFQPLGGQDTCRACPVGFFCISNTTTPSSCPAGYWCPNGTAVGTLHPCPVGRFSAALELTAATDCTPCSAGAYCASAGLTEPTAPCAAGYVCRGGAVSAAPTDNVTGNVCPAGHFCDAGTCAGACRVAPCPYPNAFRD
jgi:hypothetical protein